MTGEGYTGPVIHHGPDGTTVEGTDRADRPLVAALRAAGFRWSRSQQFWFLNRTWGEPTRRQRVSTLVAAYGDALTVVIEDDPGRSAAERDADKRGRAEARAHRMEDRAEKATAAEETARAARRTIADGIPFGQPILVGHHSEKGHRKALARMDSLMGKEVAASDAAEAAADAAERARRVAAGAESKVTIGNRIDRKEAELRVLQRSGRGEGMAAARLVDEIAFDRRKLADLGGIVHSKDTIAVGDLVRVRRIWYPVLRVNAKTVSVPWTMGAADSRATDTTPYREIQVHARLADTTAAMVRAMAAPSVRPFPGLADRLLAIAATRPETLPERRP